MPDDTPSTRRPDLGEAVWRDGASTISEAADFLSLSRRTVYELISEGRLPSRKLRGRRLVPRAALIELLSGADN